MVEIVIVTFFAVFNAQEIVQRWLGKRNTFVHGVEIIRIARGDQGTDEIKTFAKWKCRSLIFQDFGSFIGKIIALGAVLYVNWYSYESNSV